MDIVLDFFHFLLTKLSLKGSNHTDRSTEHGPEVLSVGHHKSIIEFVSVFSCHQNAPDYRRIAAH